MQKIVKKKYYRIVFELTSPLAVGSGENQVTDKDIALDSRGTPYIPGSALAGMYRGCLGREAADRYFGKIIRTENGETAAFQSRVIVYDAQVKAGSAYVTKRDMVKLDEYKTAAPGAKFDFQVLEPGVSFVTFLEQDICEGDDENILDRVLEHMASGDAVLGAKVMRGYGHIRAKKVQYTEFRMNPQEGNDLEKWLDFDIFDSDGEGWQQWEEPAGADAADRNTNSLRLRLRLSQKGGLSVRQYSTRPGGADYMQMRLHGEDGLPVIPGTTWAGAFRAQMKKLGMTEKELVFFFGCARKENGFRSRISFAESQIEGGSDVVYTRNAIDRFTGGTVDGALYTESSHYNGRTELTIQVDFPQKTKGKDSEKDWKVQAERFRKMLTAAVVDLNEGYLAVGGLTSVGRGLFEVEEIFVNGQEEPLRLNKMDAAEGYQKLLEKMTEVQG